MIKLWNHCGTEFYCNTGHIKDINFIIDAFEIELYAQNIKTTEQNGYRHMIIENRVLKLGKDLVRQKVIELKKNGMIVLFMK